MDQIASEIAAACGPFWRASGGGSAPVVDATGPTPEDRSAFRVALAASASTAAVLAAVAELTDGAPAPVDQSLALAGFTTHSRVNGEELPQWASLSGFYRTADQRFVQLHCNFDHHAAGAAARLGVGLDRSEFESAIAEWNAFDLESALIDDGMICAAYRTLDEWETHPHAAAVRDLPLVEMTPLGSGASEHTSPADVADLPLTGVRVVDCSRVLAGPVAGRTLAHLGADVVRVGAEHLPHVEAAVVVTGTGKRNVNIDLRTADGRAMMVNLVRDADIVIDAFRPGALEQYGFGPEEIAALSPATSVVQICAFDWVGSWAGRRGFDSIVQSTTGIALAGAEMSGSQTPTHLPVQVLDYATGLFAAAAGIRALHRRRTTDRSSRARLSLIRTRNWFVGLGGPVPFEPGKISPTPEQVDTIDSDYGMVELVRPFAGRWPHGPQHLGTSEPVWLVGPG